MFADFLSKCIGQSTYIKEELGIQISSCWDRPLKDPKIINPVYIVTFSIGLAILLEAMSL